MKSTFSKSSSVIFDSQDKRDKVQVRSFGCRALRCESIYATAKRKRRELKHRLSFDIRIKFKNSSHNAAFHETEKYNEMYLTPRDTKDRSLFNKLSIATCKVCLYKISKMFQETRGGILLNFWALNAMR